MIEIVNMHERKYVHDPLNGYFRVDRWSPLGNPYIMYSEEDRDRVCDAYEGIFQEMLKNIPRAMRYLNTILDYYRLHGKVYLVCWCSPLRCHAETIKKWLENHKEI